MLGISVNFVINQCCLHLLLQISGTANGLLQPISLVSVLKQQQFLLFIAACLPFYKTFLDVLSQQSSQELNTQRVTVTLTYPNISKSSGSPSRALDNPVSAQHKKVPAKVCLVTVQGGFVFLFFPDKVSIHMRQRNFFTPSRWPKQQLSSEKILCVVEQQLDGNDRIVSPFLCYILLTPMILIQLLHFKIREKTKKKEVKISSNSATLNPMKWY